MKMITRKRKKSRRRDKTYFVFSESGNSYDPQTTNFDNILICEIWSVARGWMPRTCVTSQTWNRVQISLEVSQS